MSRVKGATLKKRHIIGTFNNIKAFAENYNELQHFGQLQIRIEKLDQCWTDFDECQTVLELADETEDGIKKNSIERSSFESGYFSLRGYLTTLLNPGVAISNQTSRNNFPRTDCVKLPRINLPEFSGSLDDWLTFHDTYLSLIHSSAELSSIQKFHYLVSALKGEAADVIKTLPITSAHYNDAWELLKTRYSNTKLLIKRNLQAIIEIPPIRKENAAGLHGVLDQFNKHVKVLKQLGEPVDTWDTILIFHLCSKLDNGTLRDWEDETASIERPTFIQLNEFLNKRTRVLDSLLPSTSQTQQPASNSSKSKIAAHQAVSHQDTPSVSTISCELCQGAHYLSQCETFLQKTPADRSDFVKEKGLCANCFRSSHVVRFCRSRSCRICRKRHHTLLHFPTASTNPTSSNSTQGSVHPHGTVQTHGSIPATSTASTHAQPNDGTVVPSVTAHSSEGNLVFLETALVKILDSDNEEHFARALLDNGSQSNFISEQLCQRLKLRRQKVSIPIFGIGQTTTKVHYKVNTIIQSRVDDFETKMQFLILPKITTDLPNHSVNSANWQIPESLPLADPGFNVASKIDLIIGAGMYADLMKSGKLKLADHLPSLMDSVFGWVVIGSFEEHASSIVSNLALTCNLSCIDELDEQLTRFWRIEECSSLSNYSVEERKCEEHYTTNTYRQPDGSYVVKLPKKTEITHQLSDSKSMAIRRFYAIERRLQRNPELRNEYCDFMEKYITLGHMRKVEEKELLSGTSNSYYMPHHCVIKPGSSTTKVRVVFDASCKSTSGFSLNDLLLVGPVIQDDLLSIVMRFRTYKFVLIADIEKMYRQIKVDPEDTPLQRIVWRFSPSEPLCTYELETVTYGTSSAPFLATRTLKQLAADEASQFPEASTILDKDFYMDDCISGAGNMETALKIRKDLTSLLQAGGFCLRKWASNEPILLEDLPDEHKELKSTLDFSHDQQSQSIKTLGLTWQPIADVLRYKFELNPSPTYFTKTSVLSDIAHLFDPLGLIGPVIVIAKIFMQRLWSAKITWDENLPQTMQEEWTNFRQQLLTLHELTINRFVLSDTPHQLQELHGFCDASEQAYGACIYLRTIDEQGQCIIHLLTAKSRVAPLKKLSILRLELCSAFLLSQLYEKVTNSLKFNINAFFWSDSMIVLHWLSAPPSNWKTFIANRVSEIQQITKKGTWSHVAGLQNPADLISRGLLPNELIKEDKWWHGPQWLVSDPTTWPVAHTDELNVPDEQLERRTVVLTANIPEEATEFEIFERYSSYTRLLRIVSHCRRFIYNIQNKDNRMIGPISNEEMRNSKHKLVYVIQQRHYQTELTNLAKGESVSRKSRLKGLNAFLDPDGLIRVGGRLTQSKLPYEKRHPLLIPGNHLFSKLVALFYHQELGHGGPQLMLANIRLEFWPIAGKNLVKGIVRKCVRCTRCNPQIATEQMGNLPERRIVPAPAFTTTGIDYGGPLYLKPATRKSASLKVYIAIFVCFSTRAVHIELVPDLTTDSFLRALNRFIDRRGTCKTIYSDNATNFIGAKNELRELYKRFQSQQHQEQVSAACVSKSIEWKTIPPRSPHFGGLWEAAIKAAKRHLHRIMANSLLTYEELETIMTRVEACLNSRPLTPLSDDPNEMEALTPGHFLIGRPLTAPPADDLKDVSINRLDRWQYLQQLSQFFWDRWSVEYLTILQQRVKWQEPSQTTVKIGTLVVIKDENLPPLKWLLGRIIAVQQGQDGKIRVVTVKTKTGEFQRSIARVCILPVDVEQLENTSS